MVLPLSTSRDACVVQTAGRCTEHAREGACLGSPEGYVSHAGLKGALQAHLHPAIRQAGRRAGGQVFSGWGSCGRRMHRGMLRCRSLRQSGSTSENVVLQAWPSACPPSYQTIHLCTNASSVNAASKQSVHCCATQHSSCTAAHCIVLAPITHLSSVIPWLLCTLMAQARSSGSCTRCAARRAPEAMLHRSRPMVTTRPLAKRTTGRCWLSLQGGGWGGGESRQAGRALCEDQRHW